MSFGRKFDTLARNPIKSVEKTRRLFAKQIGFLENVELLVDAGLHG
jgi:hypothetical protein